MNTGDASLPFPWKSAFVAMIVVSIWILLLCTAPQMLGPRLAEWLGYDRDSLVREVLPVGLSSLAVVAFLLVTGRSSLLRPARPKSAVAVVLLLPLILLNFLRGPLVSVDAGFILGVLLSTFLTGFWEEFLFRGLIQERLSVLGYRLSLVVTSLLFGLIHAYAGIWKVFVAFAIGLAFSLARNRTGMWVLVVIHCLIDFASVIFARHWEGYGLTARVLIWTYFILGMAVLLGRRGDSR